MHELQGGMNGSSTKTQFILAFHDNFVVIITFK